jgi:hypothetical protein
MSVGGAHCEVADLFVQQARVRIRHPNPNSHNGTHLEIRSHSHLQASATEQSYSEPVATTLHQIHVPSFEHAHEYGHLAVSELHLAA